MELEVSPSTEELSRMRTSSLSMTRQDYSQWPMLDPTPMDHNSLLLLPRLHGLMENTQCLDN